MTGRTKESWSKEALQRQSDKVMDRIANHIYYDEIENRNKNRAKMKEDVFRY